MSKRQDADKHFRETQRAYARGGDTKMFGKQQAAQKQPGKSGKSDIRGPGEQFGRGGKGDSLSGQDAMPQVPGRTANPRRGIRANTRGYHKVR
jgi:hypothetical protein